MDFKRKEALTSRWIQPFPDTDPDCSIHIKVLSKAEMVKMYDRHKVRPGADGALLGQVLGVQEDTVKTCVLDWKGMTVEGMPIQCTDKNKIKYMLEEEIEDEDGDRTNLWLIVQAKLADILDAERKN